MRVLRPLPGGIQPAPNKRQSSGEPIAPLPLPDQLILPLLSAFGASAPCVTVGEHVLKGQRIARPLEAGVPLHAPTSGIIAAIEPAIIIRSDGRDEWIDHRGVDDYQTIDRTALLALIREAGVTGLGGAGFPAATKLAVAGPIDTLIINGAECEPYITADDRLLRERAAEVADGAAILRHLLQAQATVIAIEDDKPEAIAAITAATAGAAIEVVAIPTRYPAGGEGQLVQILTGREVPSGGIPAQIGVHCQNVGTAAAIHRAVRRGEPMISRIVTITGGAIATPGNYEVLFGTPLRHLLAHGGFDAGRCHRLIVGGPLMGVDADDTGIPVLDTTNCLLAATIEELPPLPPAQACIRCGYCADACPVALQPQQLHGFARIEAYEQLEAHHLFDCIECGACAHVCPSHIPLVQHYRQAKADIQLQRQQHLQAAQARARFDARNARLAREAVAKAAKRQARVEATKNGREPFLAPRSGDPQGGRQGWQSTKKRPPSLQAASTPAVADRVQAAIERARSKRRDATAPPATGAEADPRLQLVALHRRLANAEQRLTQARAQQLEKLPHFEENVAQLRQRIAILEERVKTVAPTSAADDPAQAAVARAFAAHQQRTTQATDPIAALEQRLAKAQAQLASAQQAGDGRARISVLESSIARLQQHLASARAERDAALDPGANPS